MNKHVLGRLARVDLRDIWTTEADDFTPWLAQEENLVVLGETLGINLEFEAQEKYVGPFRADILCKDTATSGWVLIENQLESTDHTHLGQLLTYASGLEAVTIVWIAARFVDEHRSTLDWLNRITSDEFRFFGLEVELWRIGDSLAAPKFNIVSKPNDWSRSVARAARTIDDSELTDTKLMQRDYWKALLTALENANGAVSGNRKPQPQSWMTFPIGRTKFSLATSMSTRDQVIRAEVYIGGANAKQFFALLYEQKDAVEQELGFLLEWKESRQDCRILVCLRDVDPTKESDWQQQHCWLVENLNKLHRVFASRIRSLSLD